MSYRLESEAPQTTVERTIENILTNNGIKQDEIQFRGPEHKTQSYASTPAIREAAMIIAVYEWLELRYRIR